jgi:hypothetical protein
MKFKEIINRVTGLSVPIFGIQWNPKELEVEKARRVIAFLEDKRVLYKPDSMEVPEHCVDSVLDIRRFLTNEISNLKSDTELSKNLRAMRAACRKFLDSISEEEREIVRYARQQGHWASWKFYNDLGIMRGVFSVHITQIAVSYGLDVEDELAVILPNLDEHEEGGFTKLNIN